MSIKGRRTSRMRASAARRQRGDRFAAVDEPDARTWLVDYLPIIRGPDGRLAVIGLAVIGWPSLVGVTVCGHQPSRRCRMGRSRGRTIVAVASAGAAAIALSVGTAAPALAAGGQAPGAPGKASNWVPGDKDGFGTA